MKIGLRNFLIFEKLRFFGQKFEGPIFGLRRLSDFVLLMSHHRIFIEDLQS
jgi:hypothetical protein